MIIRKVNLNLRRDIRNFIQFPFDLYRDNRYWVPPMRAEMRMLMNKDKHPFYQHSDADFFLAERDGEIVGRIAAISNTRSNQAMDRNTAFFYFFESIDEKTVSEALFSKVFGWAKERGHDQVYGPKGLLQGDGIGLLVKGFNYIPAVGIPYNFSYYDKLVKNSGFEKKFDYFSGYVDIEAGLSDKVRRVAEKVKKRSDFWVRKFESKKEILEVVPELREVYNAAFGGSEGFSPITEEEIYVIAKRMLSIADPRLIKLVYKGDQIIGFLFSYPNINRGLQKTNGRMWPFGWLHILREFKTTKYMDSNGIGILPEYQGLGSTAVIYTEMEKTFQEFDYEHVETVQTREDNIASLGESSQFGMDWVKTHRIYERDL
jgi:hypothetical protein